MTAEVSQRLLIRKATKDDLPRVLEIGREAFRLDASSQSELQGFLKECPDGLLVAQIGDEIAGYIVVYLRDGRPRLHTAAVAPKFRSHRGIGSKLVGSQLSNFRELGYREMDTIIKCTNSISIGTADKLGFKWVRTMRNFFSFPKTSVRLYVKPLSEDGKVSITGPRLRDRAKDVWARLIEPRLSRGVYVGWFDRWYDVLDNALFELPEMKDCPHELFRLVVQNPSSTRKRVALVMDRDRPLAVVGLREKGRYWVPVMQEIIPAAIAPARDGHLFRALEALRTDVRIAGWPTEPPTGSPVRNPISVPVFKIDCRGDFEKHWRKSTHARDVRLARRRTEAFTFEVDRPGSAELIIAKWEERWRDHPDQQTITASDLILAAEYLQQRGRWHSFLILDGDVPAAGAGCFATADELMYAVNIRDTTYDSHSVGTRLTDLMVGWAADHGFAKFDLGGWYPYKARWGPQDGERWEFRICPLRQHLREQAVWKARAVPAKLKSLFGRLPGLSGARADSRDQGASAEPPQETPETESGNPGPLHSPTAGVSGDRHE